MVLEGRGLPVGDGAAQRSHFLRLEIMLRTCSSSQVEPAPPQSLMAIRAVRPPWLQLKLLG